MNIAPCTKTDFDQIVSALPEFWGHDRTRALHHPMFVNEFRDSAWVIRDGASVAAYLFGVGLEAATMSFADLDAAVAELLTGSPR